MSSKLSRSLLLLCIFCLPLQAAEYSKQQLEEWFFDEADMQASQVNEGELVFLAAPPDKVVHHHYNRLTIDKQSLRDGWVKLEQCHENLDAVSRVEVVFNKDRIRALALKDFSNIGKAWIEKSSVQLQDVSQDARLCITAESRALKINTDGSFSLKNGPFMRRFLDGYYPMRVSMDVNLQASGLYFAGITPQDQQGFKVWTRDRSVHFDAWFEGRLNTEIRFVTATPLANLD